MEIYHGLDEVPAGLPSPVVTIGSFDGIHRGHQALLGRIREKASEIGGTDMLLTFEPHPQRVIAPGSAPPLLTTQPEKLPLLASAGLSKMLILPFNRALSQVEAEDFVTDILVGALGVRWLVLGDSHAFGRGRRGRPELLSRMAPEHGFELEILDAVTDEGDPITSSLIRRELAAGRVESAAQHLGRPYGMIGIVVKGDRRGRRIGFPTANLAPPAPEKCVPGDGVYAVRALLRGEPLRGVCNIGIRPTFGQGQRTVEVHLLDFDEEIYGESVELKFHSRIRGEKKFSGPEALVRQIEEDANEARSRLSEEER